jgi:hypothetical protein
MPKKLSVAKKARLEQELKKLTDILYQQDISFEETNKSLIVKSPTIIAGGSRTIRLLQISNRGTLDDFINTLIIGFKEYVENNNDYIFQEVLCFEYTRKFPNELKAPFKIIYNKYKCKIRQVKKYIFKGLAKKWLENIPNSIKMLVMCRFIHYTNPTINISILQKLYKNKEEVLNLLKQADKDGLYNLIPFIFLFGLPPKELKKQLGKGLWKKIANNSKTRNKLVVKAKIRMGIYDIIDLLDTPSSILCENVNRDVLQLHSDSEYEHANLILQYLNNRKTKPRYYEGQFNYVKDTVDMSGNLDCLRWGINRISAAHDELLEIQNQKAINLCSTKPLNNKTQFAKECYLIEDASIKSINTERDLLVEARNKKHCVFSYKKSIENNKVVIFNVVYKSENSTLMLNAKNFRVLQHYGKYNSKVRVIPKQILNSLKREALH